MFKLLFVLLIPLASVAKQDAGKKDLAKSLSLFQRKDYAGAINLQRGLVKTYPRNALYWFNLGTSAYMAKNYKLAITCFINVEILKSPLVPAAKFYRAKAEIAAGQKFRGVKILRGLLAEGALPSQLRAQVEEELHLQSPPASPLNEKVLNLYRGQRYSEALEIINQAPAPDADLQMLKGMILVKVGKTEEALQVLSAVSTTEGDAERLSLLQHLIDQTKRGEYSGRPYWAFLESAAGYDTNVYHDGMYDGSVSALVMKNRWGGGLRLANSGSYTLNSAYSGYWEEVANAGALQVISHQLQLNANYDTPTDFVQVSPFVHYDEWAGIPAQSRAGVRLKFRRLWSASALGLEFDFTSINGKHARYSYLSGSDFASRIYWAQDTKRLYGQIYFDYRKSRTGDYIYSDNAVLPIAYEGFGPGVRLMRRHSERWLHSLQISILRRRYPTMSAPGSKRRDDQELNMSLRATRLLRSDLSSYFSVSYLKNDSTLGPEDVRDENYQSFLVMTGITWDIM